MIDDTYNANPDSVRAAIDVLERACAPRVRALGDMGEVGDEGARFHEEIGAYAREHGIEHLLTLGDLSSHASRVFGPGGCHCGDVDAMRQAIDRLITKHTTLLVKGSRFMRMERVVHHLVAETTLEQKQDSH